MKGLRLVLAILVLAGVGALIWSIAGSGGPGGPAPGPGPASPGPAGDGSPELVSAADCKPCHEEVWAEWQPSWHAQAYVDVEFKKLSRDYEDKDCLPCHIPRPLFETGLENRPLARFSRYDEGISCISCHKTAKGVATARPGVKAPCRPEHEPRVASPDACGICHNQHNTTDQWRASEFAKRGMDCNGCHMPEVTRKNGRKGRSHFMWGGHDLETLKKAARLDAQVVTEAGKKGVRIVIENVGAGHNFPADARHRAVDLKTVFRDGSGKELVRHDATPGHLAACPICREQSPRFRNPYRDELGMTNTQIPAGESRTFVYPFPEGAAEVLVDLYYKLTPFTEDRDAAHLESRRLTP